jgi:aminoglycoside 6'-N-acetyltransferase
MPGVHRDALRFTQSLEHRGTGLQHQQKSHRLTPSPAAAARPLFEVRGGDRFLDIRGDTEPMISTDRLQLRQFRETDAEAFAAYRSIPEVARFQSWDSPYSLAEARTAVAGFASGDPARPGWFQYAIDLDGVLIGDLGLNLHENLMQAELGFTLAPAYQGKGYATEAVRGLLDHLFTSGNLHRVSAEADARNLPSARLLERVGFRREGLRLRNTWFKGEWTDDLLFGLLRDDWLQRQGDQQSE